MTIIKRLSGEYIEDILACTNRDELNKIFTHLYHNTAISEIQMRVIAHRVLVRTIPASVTRDEAFDMLSEFKNMIKK